MGGRVLPGETEEDAMARKFLQETGVTVSPERLVYLRTARYIWNERAQPPQDTGSDSVGYTFSVELTDEELATMAANLDPTEYDREAGLREFTRDELVTEDLHQAILDHYDAIFNNDN